MPQPQPQQIPFPAAGLHEDAGYDNQPPLTTNSINNVRSHDVLKGRIRGGRRGGLSKFHNNQINGSEDIQHILKVTRPVTYETFRSDGVMIAYDSPVGTDTHKVLDLSGTVTLTYDGGASGGYGGWDIDTDSLGNYFVTVAANSVWSGNDGTQASVIKINSSGTPQWHFDIDQGTFAEYVAYDSVLNQVVVCGRRSTTWDGAGGVGATMWALNASTGAVVWTFDHGSTTGAAAGVFVDSDGNYYTYGGSSTWTGSGGASASIWKHNPATGAVTAYFYTGDTASDAAINRDGEIIVGQGTWNTGWTGTDGSQKNCFVLDTSLVLQSSFNLASTNIPNASTSFDIQPQSQGGWILVGTPTDVANPSVRAYDRSSVQQWGWDAGDDGGGGLGNSVNVRWDGSGDVWVHGDSTDDWTGSGGTTRNFFKLGGLDGIPITTEYFADIHRRLHMERAFSVTPLSTREASLIVVAGGTIKKLLDDTLTTPTGGSSILTSQPYRVNAAQNFQNIYYVDGTDSKYYDLVADEVKDWATDVAAETDHGTLPASCRLIARYRGRIVLSGKVDDPANWFMSEAGDPLNWNFAPSTTSAIQPVAGNASEVGLVGDVVTALMPFSDDAMLIGGDQSIWQMSGDPAAGGSIDMVTDKVGVAWNAWTQDPNGAIYFLGLDGVYRIEVGQRPIKITNNRLDERFKRIDLGQIRGILEWDIIRQGLVLTLGVGTESTQVSYFWDSRTDAWTTDTYPSTMGPSYIYAYDSERADDREFLLGCKDGYIRKVDDVAPDDDGTDINAKVRYQPMPLTDGRSTGILQGVEVTLASGSGDVTLKVFTGQTAEECQTSVTPRYARTLTAGRNALATHNIRGKYVQIELSSTGSSLWAVENVGVLARSSGGGRHKRA